MKVIVIKNQDGTCAISHPCPGARGVDVRQGEPILKKEKVVGNKPGDVYAADGVLAVRGLGREETEDEFLRRIAKDAAAIRDREGKIIGEREWRIADASDIPADRTFRNAWTDANATATVDVDMGKAREIHRQRLRRERQPLLATLDVEFARAMEADDTVLKARIVHRKQQLRDITRHPDIDAATSPEDLRAAGMELLDV
jgi:hypothetical protein